MSVIPTEWRIYLAANTAFTAYVLMWFRAKSWDTGLIETLGLWTGDDHQEIPVSGTPRLFYGAQGLLRFPNGIPYEAGLDIKTLECEVGPLTTEVKELLRGYDARQAEVEVYGKLNDTEGNQVGPLARYWKGRLDGSPIGTDGGWRSVTTVAQLRIVSASREGTRIMPHKRSAAIYKQNQGDQLGKYMAVGGVVKTPWGSEGAGE